MTSLIPTTRTRRAYKTIPFLMCDFYKLSHRAQYPEGTETVYTTWIPRGTRIPEIQDGVVAFGFQGFTYEFLLDYMEDNFFKRPIEDTVREYKEFIASTLGEEDTDTSHIEAIHQLGYLPLEIKAVPEGTIVPFGIPMMLVENINVEGYPSFYWLTNFLETMMSAELWHPATAATVSRRYHQIGTKWAMKTNGNTDHLGFQFHDFSMRGMQGLHTSFKSGAAHLLSFQGTDTIPAIAYLRDYYGADYTKELVGASIPATEHSVMSAYGQDEKETFKRLINVVYPSGLVSVVSDTYDFWGNIEHTIPFIKDDILAREGKLVIRPDSGDPVKVIVGNPDATNPFERKGLVECLYDIFDGTINELGYKVLDPHIGAIYGDSITPERAEAILAGLAAKGFAASNIVFGIGSYSMGMHSRDTFNMAMKATHTTINGEEKMIFKQPKTDSSKNSLRGRVIVWKDKEGAVQMQDGLTRATEKKLEAKLVEEGNELLMQTIYKNGEAYNATTLSEIRARLV